MIYGRNLRLAAWFGLMLLAFACAGRSGTGASTPALPAAATLTIATPTRIAGGGTAAPAETISTGTHSIPFEQPVILSGHTAAVTHLDWSPDGKLLASSCGDFDSQDYTVRLWRSDGSLLVVLSGHTGPVTGLAWSPDGKTLASSALDETIRLWRPDGALIRVLHGNAGHVFAVAWSPDGKILASGSIVTFLNPTVQLWDQEGKIIKTLGTSFSGGKFYNLAWSPDGQFLLGGATDYKLWRSDGTEVYWLQGSEHSTPAWGMAWSPDSKLWAVGNENGVVSLYDTQGIKVATMQDQAGIDSLAWSADSRAIAGMKTLWRADGSMISALSGQPEYVFSVSWSPDGSVLASGGSDDTVHLFSPAGDPLNVLSGHAADVRAVAWSPDGRVLASGSADKTIQLWKRK